MGQARRLAAVNAASDWGYYFHAERDE